MAIPIESGEVRKIVILLIMEFSPACRYFTLLGPNIFSSSLLLNTFTLCSSLNVRDQVSDPYQTRAVL